MAAQLAVSENNTHRGRKIMFIVLLNYVKGLADIEVHLSDHVAYLDRYYRQGVF